MVNDLLIAGLVLSLELAVVVPIGLWVTRRLIPRWLPLWLKAWSADPEFKAAIAVLVRGMAPSVRMKSGDLMGMIVPILLQKFLGGSGLPPIPPPP